MVAMLARVLGPERLDLAEEAVQDALLRALQTWPYCGVPANPASWLWQVARNRAMDLLRREETLRVKLAVVSTTSLETSEGLGEGEDELAMMFMCCHPTLPQPARIALTLKTVGGFSTDEIAAAFLAQPTTIAQRLLVRAKRQLRQGKVALEIPSPGALQARLDSVLEVLYLLFNEGYHAHRGENLVRAELCGEGIRLVGILVRNPCTDPPRLHALLALMLLQASRLPACTHAVGDLLLLGEQDRFAMGPQLDRPRSSISRARCDG
jgi:RNA polymerase sigma-70 factor, ECF subfamily